MDNIISKLVVKDYKYIQGSINLIFEKDGNFFFIQDEYEKVKDVDKMPDYIRNDWYNFNKKDLTLEVINTHILFYKDEEELFNTLVAIRREIILNKL